jgi:hypothetical protein
MALVTIEISEQYIKCLLHYASVSRTLKQAVKLLETTNDFATLPDATVDDIDHCLGELNELTPALDHLHTITRTALRNSK